MFIPFACIRSITFLFFAFTQPFIQTLIHYYYYYYYNYYYYFTSFTLHTIAKKLHLFSLSLSLFPVSILWPQFFFCSSLSSTLVFFLACLSHSLFCSVRLSTYQSDTKKMGQGSLACIRYLLFAFTLVFVIFGVLLIYSGLTTFISFHKYEVVVQSRPDGAAIVLLTVGLAIFLTAFMGCCGAITSNTFMLRTFSFIITVLLIIELVTVSFVFAFKKTVSDLFDLRNFSFVCCIIDSVVILFMPH